MEREQLEKLLETETDRIEWKQSLADGDGFSKAVCAMANDLGAAGTQGFVLVGVNKRGVAVGADAKATPDEAQQALANRLRDINLQPTPSVSITPFQWSPGVHVFVAEVSVYAVPPAVTFRSVAYVRVGTTTRRASEADLTRLRERRPEQQQPFDVRGIGAASIDDLDITRLKETFEAARVGDEDSTTFPTFDEWLVQKELGRQRARAFVPNAAALLMFGKSPQSFFPGAYVDFARYAGTDLDSPVSTRKICTGTLTDQLDQVWALVRSNVLSTPAPAVGIREQFLPEYPENALEELTRNIVQHRAYDLTNAPARIEWFDDRVEFSNPGGPFGHASEGEFGALSDYRNPTITRMLSERGYVQVLGRGVRRARAALTKNGNPELETETDGYTRVIVRRRTQ